MRPGLAGVDEQPFVDNGPGGPAEALILDIGDDVGALILYANETCLGAEIDITPIGFPRSHHTHTMIRRRRAVSRDFTAGVVPELQAGDYTIWGLDGNPLGEVTIHGGHITEFHVPGEGAISDSPPARVLRSTPSEAARSE